MVPPVLLAADVGRAVAFVLPFCTTFATHEDIVLVMKVPRKPVQVQILWHPAVFTSKLADQVSILVGIAIVIA